jgi:hypothetical protein
MRFAVLMNPKFEYQKEDLYFAYITGHIIGESRISKPVIHFTCAKHRRFGLEVEDIYCSMQEHNRGGSKIEAKKSKKDADILLHLIANSPFEIGFYF